MTEKIARDIKQYVGFIEKCGYSVSLGFSQSSYRTLFLPLLQYDYHPHRICDYMKANGRTQGLCVKNKQGLLSEDLREPCYTCCFAGVEEFVFPVRYEDELVACIHVSGYRGGLARSEKCRKNIEGLCDSRFPSLYEELCEDIPSVEQVSAFAEPLAYMLKEFCKCAKTQKEQDALANLLYCKALQLLYDGEIETWDCAELAKRLNYSESYLRYVFMKAGGVSLQKRINQIRLQKAKRLLKSTNESVTRIAFSLGFSDSNYFSTFFKKHVGASPLKYRKDGNAE